MAFNIKTWPQLVSDQVTAIQARAAGLVDTTIGSLMRALAESNASVVQWLQQLVLQLLARTRASTSSGEDLDSWLADFGFARLPAVEARGFVTFARFTPNLPALIPAGATVETADGSQSYVVVPDASNPAWSAERNGYALPAGAREIALPVVARRPGEKGNALSGMVTQITGAIPGVDTCVNAAAMAGGRNAESDDAVRARFVAWVASLSKATRAAVEYAVLSMAQGMSCVVVENRRYDGVAQPGFFYVVVDDGTGSPTATTLSSAYNAIDLVRPFTSTFAVFKPARLSASIRLAIRTDGSVDHNDACNLVRQAIIDYVNRLKLGQSLPWSMIASLAYAASPAITNVTDLTLNGGTADLIASGQQVIKTTDVGVI
ncbi:baseplate J/gp47 family protein [Paludibacterium paludis]|uniref:Baseplate protein J-like barrel domain-containing protein n=1 Tax=Paludibacterium paludis TaxID=1225769 RepID=A0A918NYT0_9NEIS|nr:baseplate J/gp47 family protein [Paludibacterium paludis]GGY07046.1 hypothetical protein GCM10011289_07070 [Paludibacterium paludis]